MRIILIIVAAITGAALASEARTWFGALLGAFAAWGIAEFISLRRRANELEREMASMRKEGAFARAAQGAKPTRDTVADEQSAAAGEPDEMADGAGFEQELEHPDESVPYVARKTALGRTEVRDFFEGQSRPEPHLERQAGPDGAPAAQAQAAAPPRITLPPENVVFRAIREYFTGGNTLVRVGVIILFVGVAFLLKYVAEHTYVPIQLRLSGVAAAGVVLLGLGWRLRLRRPGYALTLQGGAIGILYLTVFASLRLFSVMPASAAFGLLVLLSAFAVVLAVLQNSLAFGLLALSCGFLAPVLASTGQGNHVVLFSYYGVLNLAIIAIAWFKAWRPLNVAGFLFTFVIGTAWGVLKYKPEFLSTTEPFLVGFFLLYVAIAVLFCLRQKPVLNGYVDGTIVFGVPAVAFGLQSALVRHIPFALAFSAAGVSAMYLTLAWMLHRGKRETQRLLVEAFMALGVVFLTLTIPLALDGRWSAATWALEGAALVWIGCRQDRRLPRAFGALLQLAGGMIFLFDLDAPRGDVPVLNSAFLGGVMIAFGSIFAATRLRKQHERLFADEKVYAPVLFFWGLAWWLGSGIAELDRIVPSSFDPAAVLIYIAGTAILCSELKRRFDLVGAKVSALMLLPVMVAFAALMGLMTSFGNVAGHPMEDAFWLAWPVAFAAFYLVCRRHEEEGVMSTVLHVASAWLLVLLLTWEFAWQVNHAVNGSGSWPVIAWAIIPGVALFFMPKLPAPLPWPVGKHEAAYVGVAGAGLAIVLMFWSLGTNLTLRGDPYPLPYVPLLNPLDLAQAFVLLVLVRHWLRVRSASYPVLRELPWQWAAAMLAGLSFIWLNAVLLRTLHHWAGVPFDLGAMASSALVQTSVSIFWTVLALTTMLVATRFATRIVWLAGAVLLGAVVAKLAIIDLSRVGTVERIVSFVVVGLLILVIGYFSPMPPAREERA
jgi:uncharacterized membrane protein